MHKAEPASYEPLLLCKTANQWLRHAKQMAVPKTLFCELWHEGELAILFADTNVGKSILAVQIGDGITRGRYINNSFSISACAQPVLYCDYEMSCKQFEKRYSRDYEDHYVFSSDLFRVELNPDYLGDEDFILQFITEVEEMVHTTATKILIIDNISYLVAQSTETARDAVPLMKSLKELKSRLGLSILLLAHTPKIAPSSPIGLNHLSGSRSLANFADSIFAIGKSALNENTRYIKQLKTRATEIHYHSDNVMVCELNKNGTFLGFDFIELSSEREHLRELSDSELLDLDTNILSLHQANPAMTHREIARKLGTNHTRVGRVIARN